MQTRLWHVRLLELTHPETKAKRTISSLVLPLDNATPEQRQVMLGVLHDKYELNPRESRSQSQTIIRVDDRSEAKDARRLDVLLHMADPANWRKSLVEPRAGGPKIPILSYRMRSLQDGRIAAELLNRQNVEYQPTVVLNRDISFRLQVTGDAQVRQLLQKLPALQRNLKAIPDEEPNGGGWGEMHYKDWLREWQQHPHNRDPVSKPEPSEAVRVRERAMRDMETALRADEARRQKAYTELRQIFPTASKAHIRRPSLLHQLVMKFFSSVLTPEERLRESERQSAYIDRETRGTGPSTYDAPKTLRPQDRVELNQIARANPDGSQDQQIKQDRAEREQTGSEWARKQREALDAASLHPGPTAEEKEAMRLRAAKSRGYGMGR